MPLLSKLHSDACDAVVSKAPEQELCGRVLHDPRNYSQDAFEFLISNDSWSDPSSEDSFEAASDARGPLSSGTASAAAGAASSGASIGGSAHIGASSITPASLATSNMLASDDVSSLSKSVHRTTWKPHEALRAGERKCVHAV